MPDDDAPLSAEVLGLPDKTALATRQRADGFGVVKGAFSLRLTDFDYFVFRDFDDRVGSCPITADPPDDAVLATCATGVSGTLARAGIRHRFEVYAGQGDPVGYLHHNWPKTDSGR